MRQLPLYYARSTYGMASGTSSPAWSRLHGRQEEELILSMHGGLLSQRRSEDMLVQDRVRSSRCAGGFSSGAHRVSFVDNGCIAADRALGSALTAHFFSLITPGTGQGSAMGRRARLLPTLPSPRLCCGATRTFRMRCCTCHLTGGSGDHTAQHRRGAEWRTLTTTWTWLHCPEPGQFYL